MPTFSCHYIGQTLYSKLLAFLLLFQKSSVPPLSDVIAASRAQVIQYASLVIQGCFEKEQVTKIKTLIIVSFKVGPFLSMKNT